MNRNRPRVADFSFVILLLGAILIAGMAAAGVHYDDPAGGWRYSYEGTFNAGVIDGVAGGDEDRFIGDFGPAGYGGQPAPKDENDVVGALDGTWSHSQGDKWDGTAPGDPLSDPTVSASPPVSLTGKQGTAPGGAGAFNEGSTDYIRIQDSGNPEVHGWIQGLSDPDVTYPTGPPAPPIDPINTNRRVFFGHDMTQDGPLADELVLTNTGVTFSVRMRIPVDGPLDDAYTTLDLDNDQEPDVIPWFQDSPNGRGMPMTNGRGIVNISQNAPDNVDTQVGFSLVTSTDIELFCSGASGSLCTGSGSGGLIMNNLNGNAPSDLIDSESGGTLNILEIPDDELNEWNEFWITMENNGPVAGNIEVNVYRNGATTPETFQVTLAGNKNSAYADEDNPFLEFGISDNAGFGSFDLDFFSYALGVHEPVAAPLTDADGDGDVDGADFLLIQRDDPALIPQWEADYGNGIAAAAIGAAVPEPTACALALLAACLAPRRRRL